MTGTKRRVIEGARNTLRENGIYEPAFRVWAGSKARARSLRHIDETAVDAYLSTRAEDRRLIVVDSFEGERDGWLQAAANPKRREVVCLRQGIQLPAPDASFSLVFVEHSLELRALARGELLLRECYRLLEEGGLIRISTMNLEFVLDLLRNRDDPAVSRYLDYCYDRFPEYVTERRMEHLVNSMFRAYGHTFLYSEAMVHDLLAGMGFVDIRTCTAETSSRPDLRRLHEGRDIAEDIISQEALFVEAVRP